MDNAEKASAASSYLTLSFVSSPPSLSLSFFSPTKDRIPAASKKRDKIIVERTANGALIDSLVENLTDGQVIVYLWKRRDGVQCLRNVGDGGAKIISEEQESEF